jgi:drug/metabolite transporter (DMT)-like permease
VLGVLAAIGALGGMTIGTLYEKRFGISQHPVTANTIQYAAGLATTLPLAFLLEDRTIEWSLPLGLSLLYLIVCNSLIALTLLLLMIRRGEVSRVSALFFLVPPMAALIGWLLLDEQMPPLAWVGLALAAAGVAIATRSDRLLVRRSRPGIRS